MPEYTKDQIKTLSKKLRALPANNLSDDAKDILSFAEEASRFCDENDLYSGPMMTLIQPYYELIMDVDHISQTIIGDSEEECATTKTWLLTSMLIDEKKTLEAWQLSDQKLQMIASLSDDPIYTSVLIAKEAQLILDMVCNDHDAYRVQLLMQDTPDQMLMTIIRQNPELILSEKSQIKYDNSFRDRANDQMEKWLGPQDDLTPHLSENY